mmetsp:Transcript_4461/g.7440  ORF Transcript_4461/g.7440 Transcript_4461/m.7440 type:complete len:188 (+) Transcript_4461:188-751(+)|eukprot:CAMPEP_0119104480 /NCGR_PEP_ID=MMETSP1180-20130426/2679_1 /TAXON_ID=3052 ORGANISM="Chlamydomonas cf sp, Strain CCMP681" /NCGR_SAMPLE_ID=MMETSP1180 /ASSEMBLY_ACC=CAM_ASM_000741 /LENGTH=187 /DNA_ID=CAMNT_0007089249 /DNA_START=160 /DNA_END=723 /DNA_ORIENTATION=-
MALAAQGSMMSRAAPVMRAGCLSASVFCVSDLMAQHVQNRHKLDKSNDWKRTARFSLVGLTLHGPFFLWGFGMLDKTMGPGKTLTVALKKTALGQVTLFPTYLTAFFMYMSALEGTGFEGGRKKIQDNFVAMYTSGSVFWPVANVTNFMFVAPAARMLYVNACSLLWNAFLSWYNNTTRHQQLICQD